MRITRRTVAGPKRTGRQDKITSAQVNRTTRMKVVDTPLAQGLSRRLQELGIFVPQAAAAIGVSRSSLYAVLTSRKKKDLRPRTLALYQDFIEGRIDVRSPLQRMTQAKYGPSTGDQALRRALQHAVTRMQAVLRDLQVAISSL
jgi:hypothetical protein